MLLCIALREHTICSVWYHFSLPEKKKNIITNGIRTRVRCIPCMLEINQGSEIDEMTEINSPGKELLALVR